MLIIAQCSLVACVLLLHVVAQNVASLLITRCSVLLVKLIKEDEALMVLGSHIL